MSMIRGVIAATVLFGAAHAQDAAEATPGAAPQPTGPVVHHNLDASKIGDILKTSGYSVSEFGAGMVAVTVADQVILVGTEGPDDDISYIAYVPGLTERMVGYEFLNNFNNSIKFGRVYADREGDIVVQYDRNAAGGVTKGNVTEDFDLFLDLISLFLSELANVDSV